VATSPQVSGVRVTAPDGTELIDGKPSVTRAGATEKADLLEADGGFPATARDVTVTTGVDGSATASVGEFTQVPDRSELGEYRWNALRVYGLELAVKADGTSSVSFDNPSSAVFVNGVWINTATDLYTGVDAAGAERVRVHLNERMQNPDGSTTITALRYEDLTHANPDVRLGTVVLPAPDPVVVPPSTGVGIASTVGVLVTSPTGETLIDGQPRLDAAGGSVTSALVAASQAFPARAKNVTVTADKTGAAVSLDEFTQVPDTSAIGEYVWSALRVYGLNLAVAPDGSSTVTFDNVSSAVFVNGVWINTATDLYTGVDAAGAERVRVHLNERVQNADGSTTITALHYEDLTGAYPDVRLGIVTVTPASTEPTPDPTPEPTPPPGNGGTELPARHAYGVQATGPSVIDAAPLASAAAVADALLVGDGAAGQVSVVAPSARVDASRSEVTTGPISLYPGTSIAVELAGLTVVTTPSSIEVSSLGGTIGDTAIAAGPIAPNTVVALAGSNVRVVLNEQILTADEATVIGVHVSDAAGLGADVRVGAITSAAIEVAPVPDPSPTPDPSTPGTPANPGTPGAGIPGSGLMPGALTPDGNSPAGTSGTNNRGLAATGAESGIAIGWAAAGLIVAGFGALALAKRRYGTAASRKWH
jgi:archaellum component FlaG (FlaF/FlaG flagellin family)